jgi:large subunit ribosomal protein L6
MSRIGKLPVTAPAGVDVKVASGLITVKGPKGELQLVVTDDVNVKMDGRDVQVEPRDPENAKSRAMWGTTRAWFWASPRALRRIWNFRAWATAPR